MKQEVTLYLAGQEVYFNEPPEILFSYIRTDYTDPTVLRNSYSKTLTIEGTPENNALFNGIYHLDKISDYGTFNPAKRMAFELHSNGDVLENGYAKLDRINKKGKNISYDITLYGGLGEFLYNLSYDQTEEGSDTSRGGGEDRRLSSLIYYDETAPNQEFDFDITKDTVAEAWEALEKGTGDTKWKYINFAPAYNGLPEDFDSDKVLINTQNSSVPVTYNNNGVTGFTSGGFPTSLQQGEGDSVTTYRTYNNYALGELPKEMTEWEMRDLRSYLQRPVLSMKGFISAISNPANNGGYQVELDNSFFNSNNPYYEKAWFTLPLLKKDETVTGQSAKTEVANDVLSVSSSLGDSYDKKYYLQGLTPGAVYNGIDLTFQLTTDVSGMPEQIMTTAIDYQAGGILAMDAGYFSSIFVQLVGEDADGNKIAASDIYNFTSPYGDPEGVKVIFGSEWEGPQNRYCAMSEFPEYEPDYTMGVKEVVKKGRFVKTSGNHYVWQNIDGNVENITLSLDSRYEYQNIYFRVTKCFHWLDKSKGSNPSFNRFERDIFSAFTSTEEKRRNVLVGWTANTAWLGGDYMLTAKTATTQTVITGSQAKYTVVSDVVRSGDHISKGNLLNFDGTPCDYLLSYCKLFNLYLSKDLYDKKIYIRTRDSFYNGGTIDLEEYIDRSKDIKVSPLAMESRWYDFAYPEDEMCGAAEDYDFNYGVEYGKNKVQTTYEFDSAAKNLFEGNIYQNGVQVQESSKYYTLRTVRGNPRDPSQDGYYRTVPTFLYNSIEYKLFNTPNDTLPSCTIFSPSNYSESGYTSSDGKEDWAPKLQLNNNNDAVAGENILCFYTGFESSPSANTGFGTQQAIYYLTDDLAEMYTLNGETPCWLWTKTEENNGVKIAKGMTKLPVFSRMMYSLENTTGTSNTKIAFTWDFGRVRDTYVPVKSYIEKSTIYERWWSNYIADLYDYNTRVVECYVKMQGKVVGDWLRSFYWWDNSYWVLTEINDYDITSYDTTRCKFVKVNDLTNYTSGITPPQQVTPTATLVPSKYMIKAAGETITARVVTSDGGAWRLEYPSYVHPSQTAGTGDTNITLQFDANPNDDGREFDVRAFRTAGTPTHFWQEGSETTEKRLSNTNKYYLCGGGPGVFGTTLNYKNRGNDTVTVTYNADWLEILSPVSWGGDVGSITFRITGTNETEQVKSTTITFQGVNNSALTDTMIVDWLPKTLNYSGDGGTKTLNFLNTGIQIVPQDGYWASFNTEANTGGTQTYATSAQFIAPVNTAESPRTEKVLVRYRSASDPSAAGGYIDLVQQCCGGILVAAPSALTAGYEEGYKVFTVNATMPWSATSYPEWVTLSQTTGIYNNITVIVRFDENDGDSARTGTIVITDGIRTATVNLTQNYNPKQNGLTVTPDTLYFEFTGSTKYITLASDYNNWSLVSKPGWAILSQTSGGTGTSLISVTVPANTTEASKYGEFIFTDGVSTGTVSGVQATSSTTKTLTVTPTSYYAENSGGTPNFNVTFGNRFGDDVNITASESWITPGYVRWSGDSGTFPLTIANYGVNLERQATVTVTSVLDPTLTQTITIRQKAFPYVTLNPNIVRYTQTGGTVTLELDSNTDWIIDINDTTNE